MDANLTLGQSIQENSYVQPFMEMNTKYSPVRVVLQDAPVYGAAS